jgi:hypothetical protein
MMSDWEQGLRPGGEPGDGARTLCRGVGVIRFETAGGFVDNPGNPLMRGIFIHGAKDATG